MFFLTVYRSWRRKKRSIIRSRKLWWYSRLPQSTGSYLPVWNSLRSKSDQIKGREGREGEGGSRLPQSTGSYLPVWNSLRSKSDQIKGRERREGEGGSRLPQSTGSYLLV